MAVGKHHVQLNLFEVSLCPAAKMLSVDTCNDHEMIEVDDSDDNIHSSDECDDGKDDGFNVTQSKT